MYQYSIFCKGRYIGCVEAYDNPNALKMGALMFDRNAIDLVAMARK